MEHIKCSITSVCIVLSMDIETDDKGWRKARTIKKNKRSWRKGMKEVYKVRVTEK